MQKLASQKKRHIQPKPGQEFYSFSKLTILQSLSLSNYSNTSENPGIHTSEYVGSSRTHRKFFFEAPETSLRISTNVTKKTKTKKKPSHQTYVL